MERKKIIVLKIRYSINKWNNNYEINVNNIDSLIFIYFFCLITILKILR